jgi:drug/metabolite transporter (DMT)-like permease
VHAFTLKVAAERGVSSGYFNAYSCTFSAVVGLVIVLLYAPFVGEWMLGALLAFISGVIYVSSSSTRIESLRSVTASLYFPISKSATVVFSAFAGVLLFAESITTWEMLGLAIALLVPLMLLHPEEIPRQKNIRRGIVFLIIASLFSTAGTVLNKYSTGVFLFPLVFVVLTHISIACVGWVSGFLEEHRRAKEGKEHRHRAFTAEFALLCACAGMCQLLGFWTNIVSLGSGPLSLAYAIMSFQMLVPMLLSAVIYKEHWDVRKVGAFALSCVSMYFIV